LPTSNRHLSPERQALQVEEARRALQIGQRVRFRALQPIELGPAGELPPKHVHEGHVMALQDPHRGGHVARDIVDHLRRRTERPTQEDTAHPDEGLGVDSVRCTLDTLDDLVGEVALATDVGSDRLCRRRRAQARRLFHLVMLSCPSG
jgi:hypothetical protein